MLKYREMTAADNVAVSNLIRNNLKKHNLDIAIHIYQKSGYTEIEKPKEVVHSAINRFFKKSLF